MHDRVVVRRQCGERLPALLALVGLDRRLGLPLVAAEPVEAAPLNHPPLSVPGLRPSPYCTLTLGPSFSFFSRMLFSRRSFHYSLAQPLQRVFHMCCVCVLSVCAKIDYLAMCHVVVWDKETVSLCLFFSPPIM